MIKRNCFVLLIASFFLLLSTHNAYSAEATPPFNINDATIDTVHQAIKSHQLTCLLLVKQYINRIQRYDLNTDYGPPLNAFVAINPSVYEEARQLDKEFKQTNNLVGPLHCVPVIVKDNIDTIDTPSTSGSLALLGSQPTKDAFLVKQMKKAGAIILGKGTMDEFASGMASISSRSGRTGNAYDPNQNPGGSSAGPTVAVSANFAIVGIGSDNSGSVRIPAGFNGIYGLRPSTGLISQRGIFPRGNLDGVAGPLTRNVKDLAAVLSIIARPDPHDPKTQQSPGIKSYLHYLDKDALKGKRIGIVKSVARINPYKGMSDETKNIIQKSISKLQESGAVIIQDITFRKFNTNRKNNMAGEIQDVNDYLKSFPSTRKSFGDICLSNRTQTFDGIKGCLKHIKDTAKRDSKAYKAALKIFARNRNYVESIMKQHHLDALLMPLSAEGSASYELEKVNTGRIALSSNSGLPAIVINAGYTDGPIKMPVGIELIGKQYTEGELIGMAYSYEQHSDKRLRPKLLEPVTSSVLEGMTIPEMNNLFFIHRQGCL